MPIAGVAQLRRAATPHGARWVVIGPPSLRLNGAALDVGIAVMVDRDELCVGGRRMFFTTESVPTVVPFPGSDRPVSCARCGSVIAPGSPAVACPTCGLWYHESEELPCWTYGPHCVADDQPTALDAELRFSPEDL